MHICTNGEKPEARNMPRYSRLVLVGELQKNGIPHFPVIWTEEYIPNLQKEKKFQLVKSAIMRSNQGYKGLICRNYTRNKKAIVIESSVDGIISFLIEEATAWAGNTPLKIHHHDPSPILELLETKAKTEI